jgi:hypothetical protein
MELEKKKNLLRSATTFSSPVFNCKFFFSFQIRRSSQAMNSYLAAKFGAQGTGIWAQAHINVILILFWTTCTFQKHSSLATDTGWKRTGTWKVRTPCLDRAMLQLAAMHTVLVHSLRNIKMSKLENGGEGMRVRTLIYTSQVDKSLPRVG